MNRRGFLGAMLAAATAPAFVRAESLMKIAVPKKEIILPPSFARRVATAQGGELTKFFVTSGRGRTSPLLMVDEAAFGSHISLTSPYFGEAAMLQRQKEMYGNMAQLMALALPRAA